MLIFLVLSLTCYSQEEGSSPLDLGADIMSRYIWRGTDWASPSIQPYIELGLGNFSLGAWGAYITNPQSKKVYLVFGISF